ncbi:hypothetical protein ATO7_01590 [Oceanococcus atlanticus]|uniref:Uncharacterized protein n=1 Tax=Oceanococcus atlanticus TaxID=1317117 RepID=A0A1Y1SFU7_9GAMM|nr:hypothetical protein [Oceanococcus atlanticus]ORE88527.1 hypothetical protein ATO7_01590 [Oceanococcus atlanticus]RZO85402.1 MAG: hypothetical protein EVA65_05955 [Oceanococcus sp.]
MATVALKAGARFKSAVCDTQVMVIKAPAGDYTLECGGVLMIAPNEDAAGELNPEHAGGTQMGKRYVDPDEKFELLCTKPGKGSLVLDGTPLDVKQAKQLPSSD